jgi:1-deoxy-D-xylulose-5-phosphate reductoisomerase
VARNVTILGSTGSIGQSALKVARAYPEEIEIYGLSAHSNSEEIIQQIHEFHPSIVTVAEETTAKTVQEACPDQKVLYGNDGLLELATDDRSDILLSGIVGAAGLMPILHALQAGIPVALANKEPMVMAGHHIMEIARIHNTHVLPVDSEHNAIFQCLQGHQTKDVHKIHLTASGGPFYRQPRSALEQVSPEQAVKHPTWDMGAKISIDSATLMNKGLEVIEAMWLFDVPLEKIDVVIHPQSIIHSLVEFTDGSILAHLGVTDMTLPIQYALTWPNRVKTPMARLDLTQMKALTFDAPDFSEFPCLGLALHAAETGGTAGTALNAANETAVAAFRDLRIPFLQIPNIIDTVLNTIEIQSNPSLDTILQTDKDARRRAETAIEAI